MISIILAGEYLLLPAAFVSMERPIHLTGYSL
jgi:hypothetical protein